MRKVELRTERYAAQIQRRYTWLAQRFLDYLESKTLAIETVRARELEDFLRWELRSFVAGTDGPRVILSIGVGDTQMPFTWFYAWCMDSGQSQPNRRLPSKHFIVNWYGDITSGCEMCAG
jgi:hypothetical protein